MKGIKKVTSILMALLMFLSMQNVYAAEHSFKVERGNIISNKGYSHDLYTQKKVYKKDIVFENGYFYIKNDLKLYNNNGNAIADNVVMVSDLDKLNNMFYFLDTKGDLFESRLFSDWISEPILIKEKIGDLNQLDFGVALTKKGELYFGSTLIDTNVKSYHPYTRVEYSDYIYGGSINRNEYIYLKDDNSLYSLNFQGISTHLLDNVSTLEFKHLQIRAKTMDNKWYEWGDNSKSEVYIKMVDGYDVAPKYVDIPQLITDNILYETEEYQLRIDGGFYLKKKVNRNEYKYTLCETDVDEFINFGSGYLCQKKNDDIYFVSFDGKSQLICNDAVNGLSKAFMKYASHLSVVQKKDGMLVIIDNNGKIVRSISPLSKYFGSSNWAQTELQEADNLGILDSVMDFDFYLDISRQEFCVMIVDMCETYLGKEMPIASSNPFTDVNEYITEDVKEAILKAYNAGIINGINATSFWPDYKIDREQIAMMMYRAVKYLKPDIKFNAAIKFADAKEFSSWAVEGIDAMSSLSIIKGSNGKLLPKSKTTVEQASIMVLRLFKILK